MRSSADTIFVTGDSVYYKRKEDAKWKGQGKVMGLCGQQVLVKHGSISVCGYPYCLMLKCDGDNTVNNHLSFTLILTDLNPGRSNVTKIGTDPFCPKVNSIIGPGYVYSDESDTETDTISKEKLPGQ